MRCDLRGTHVGATVNYPHVFVAFLDAGLADNLKLDAETRFLPIAFDGKMRRIDLALLLLQAKAVGIRNVRTEALLRHTCLRSALLWVEMLSLACRITRHPRTLLRQSRRSTSGRQKKKHFLTCYGTST